MKEILRAAFGAALALAVATPASAMNYSARLLPKAVVIDATGEIAINEQNILWDFLQSQQRFWGKRKIASVVFDSPGGSPYGAVAIAGMITRSGVNTGVAHGGTCASACAIAWAGGRRKSVAIDARVGVHRPTTAGLEDTDPTMASMNTALANTVGDYLQRRSAPEAVIAGELHTPPSQMYWLTPRDFSDWGVRVTD